MYLIPLNKHHYNFQHFLLTIILCFTLLSFSMLIHNYYCFFYSMPWDEAIPQSPLYPCLPPCALSFSSWHPQCWYSCIPSIPLLRRCLVSKPRQRIFTKATARRGTTQIATMIAVAKKRGWVAWESQHQKQRTTAALPNPNPITSHSIPPTQTPISVPMPNVTIPHYAHPAIDVTFSFSPLVDQDPPHSSKWLTPCLSFVYQEKTET